MSDRIMRVWREMIRRRVVRTGAAYAAVSFVALQLGEILLPAYGAGPAGLRSIFAGLLAGFPVVLAVSWVYDIGSSGLRRTNGSTEQAAQDGIQPPSRRLALSVLLASALLGAFGWWVVGGGIGRGAIPASMPSVLTSAVVLIAVSWWSVRESCAGPVEMPERKLTKCSVAVLPFAYWSTTSGEPFLGEALADDIRNLLAGVRGVRVVARTSCRPKLSGAVDVREVGRELGVCSVLEGSVLQSEALVRVTAHLVDTRSGFRIWSGSYSLDGRRSLLAYEEIARSVVRDLVESKGEAGRLLAG